MSYSLDVYRPTAIRLAGPSETPAALLRIGVPVLAGVLSAAGLLLVWAGHRQIGPVLFVAGAGLSAVMLGARALETEQVAGRL